MTPSRRDGPMLDEHDVATALQRSVPDRDPRPDLAGRARVEARRLRTRRRTALASGIAAVTIAVAVPLLASLYADTGTGAARPDVAGAPTSAHPCADNPCSVATVRAAIRRPLTVPELAPGQPCPVSGSRRFPAAAGFSAPFRAVGSAPLYVAAAKPEVRVDPERGRWLGQKVIWVLDDSYAGAVLLHGTRIDGEGELRFLHYIGAAGYTDGAGDGKAHPELLYVRAGLTEAPDEAISSYPSGIFVDSPGCYAVQADGVGFSTTLVLQVRLTAEPVRR